VSAGEPFRLTKEVSTFTKEGEEKKREKFSARPRKGVVLSLSIRRKGRPFFLQREDGYFVRALNPFSITQGESLTRRGG